MTIDRRTRWKRINKYGYTRQEAVSVPIGKPLWMYRIEKDEGMPMRQILDDAAKAASHTGYTLHDLAREWGVKPSTLHHWAAKWGITFPRGVSESQKMAVSESAKRMNAERRVRG